MQFGYFTLSDNRYPGNTRSAEDFLKDIFAEALYAETVGLNSAWIGEHHFNLLGVNASPLAILAQLAGATTKLRLAPAVTLLPGNPRFSRLRIIHCDGTPDGIAAMRPLHKWPRL